MSFTANAKVTDVLFVLVACLLDVPSQTRTKVLNDEPDNAFRNWYPQFRAEAA